MGWFPRAKGDLDKCAKKILEGGKDLKADHPGFKDQEYRKRRKHFADYAINYKHGQKIENVEYTQEEIRTWGVVYNKLTELYPTHACKEYNDLFSQLVEKCELRADRIPQLDDISRYLQDCTGFQLRPVAGLLSFRDFLAGFAFRIYYCTQYVRHRSEPFYNPEPDVCHEMLGHVPLLSDPSFAKVAHEIGLASLGASDDYIEQLSRVFWFTIEYGLCKQDGKQKAYGAGLLSSYGELNYCFGGDDEKPEVQPLNVFEAAKQKYPITTYQPIYYLAESFTDAINQAREFAKTVAVSRPFTIHYDPYTQSVKVIDNKEWIQEMASDIKHNIGIREEPQQKVQTHEELSSPTEELPSRKSTSEPQQSTSEQAIQTYGDISCDVRTTEYLRGFKPFAETCFVAVGSQSQSFEWQGYGLKLHIPEGALPTDHTECRIDIKVGLSGQFSFPDGSSQLVSCVYWVCCSQKFLKSVTLDIEHCASVQDSSQSSSLHFVAARCSQADLPYQFKELKQATFSPQSSFGSVQVSQFSFFGIFGPKNSQRYSALSYYYKGSIYQWWMYFFIIYNTEAHRKAIETELQAIERTFAHQPPKNCGCDIAVKFQKGEISLKINKDGDVLDSGWKITPMAHPGIERDEVDQSCNQLGQRFPNCRLSVVWTRKEEPVDLEHRVDLIGTKQNFIYIKVPPVGRGVPEAVSPPSSEDEDIDQLDEKDLPEIADYLHGMGKTDIYHLGLALGLNDGRMRQIKDSDTFLEDMVRAWLQKVDQVQERGAPSWWRLVEALRSTRIGQNGIADKITKDKNIN